MARKAPQRPGYMTDAQWQTRVEISEVQRRLRTQVRIADTIIAIKITAVLVGLGALACSIVGLFIWLDVPGPLRWSISVAVAAYLIAKLDVTPDTED